MYDSFYNFSSEPFCLSPDHYFAYEHSGYRKARAYMAYAYMRAEGFVMITGRPGTGKTTLIGALVEQLAGENVATANLVCTQVQADDLLKLVAYEFGVDPNIVTKGELLQRLEKQLKTWNRDGKRALLVVDEAQDLSVTAMEELRLLTNINANGKPLLQIFLLGQPELRELILSPRLEQVHQRIVASSNLQPLECDETEAYIRHRLEAVGWRGDPSIRPAIYPLIHKFSEGIPRRINLICSRLFLHCAVEQRHEITLEDMREVVGELQGENLAAGAPFSEHDFREQSSAPEAPRPPADGLEAALRNELSSAREPQQEESSPPDTGDDERLELSSTGSDDPRAFASEDASGRNERTTDTDARAAGHRWSTSTSRQTAAGEGAQVVSMKSRGSTRRRKPLASGDAADAQESGGEDPEPAPAPARRTSPTGQLFSGRPVVVAVPATRQVEGAEAAEAVEATTEVETQQLQESQAPDDTVENMQPAPTRGWLKLVVALAVVTVLFAGGAFAVLRLGLLPI